jgi:hypothetical protein
MLASPQLFLYSSVSNNCRRSCSRRYRAMVAFSIGVMEFEWLRDAIRLPLEASLFTSATDGEKGLPQQWDPRFRKLVVGILLSRKFVPKYHLVILGFICLVSAIHQTEIAIRWRGRAASRLRALAVENGYNGDAVTIKTTAYNSQDLDGTDSSGISIVEGTSSSSGRMLTRRLILPTPVDPYLPQTQF